jgi:hypothetical protein
MDDTGLSDSGYSGHTVTLNNGVSRSAVQSKFGGFSALFDGVDESHDSTGTLSDFTFAGDFTLSGWWYYNSLTGNQSIFGIDNTEFKILTQPSLSQWELALSGGGTGVKSFTFATGQWYHIVVAREGSTVRVFFDGVLQHTTTNGSTLASVNTGISLGTYATGGVIDQNFNGYLDEFHIVNGLTTTINAAVPTPATSFAI